MSAIKAELLEILRNSLRIEVETESVYTGGMDGSDSLYAPRSTITLLLDDEIISSATIN